MRRNKMKKNVKGITLIALVITIIIMLILAGVSLNVMFGENGLITRAKGAGLDWKKEEFREQVIADLGSALGSCYEEGNYEPTLEDVAEKMEEMGYTVTDNENGTITVEKEAGTAIIDAEFNVTVEGVPTHSIEEPPNVEPEEFDVPNSSTNPYYEYEVTVTGYYILEVTGGRGR